MNKFVKFQILCLFFIGLIPLMAYAQSPSNNQKNKAVIPIPVVVQVVTEEPLVDRVEAIGTLRANETIILASTVTETVTALNFEDGQRVKKGDILVEMARGEEKARIDEQRALVREAQQQLDRARELARTGAVSRTILDQRQREYTAAVSGMAALQARLDDYLVTAPFDGVVGMRNISVGALLQPGTQITTLDDDTTMKLDFSVPSVFLPSLKPGLTIIARASGFPQSFNGTITAIGSQINPDTRAVSVRAILPNPDGMLKPGLLMTIELLKNPRDAVVIDENAIIPEGRKAYVLVVNPTANPLVPEKREVTLGTRRPGNVEITEHLRVGEQVIVKGTMVATPGKPVIITQILKHNLTSEPVIPEPSAGEPVIPAIPIQGQ